MAIGLASSGLGFLLSAGTVDFSATLGFQPVPDVALAVSSGSGGFPSQSRRSDSIVAVGSHTTSVGTRGAAWHAKLGEQQMVAEGMQRCALFAAAAKTAAVVCAGAVLARRGGPFRSSVHRAHGFPRCKSGTLIGRRAKTELNPGEKVVGIDLGTTNSVVAAMEAGRATVIPNEEGERTTPSVVAFSKGELLVGQLAKRQGVVNPENTFSSVKRFVGCQPQEVVQETKEVSYRVEIDGPQVRFACPELERQLAPEEVSSQVIRKLSTEASQYLKAEVSKAIITVPAYFNDSQRQATRDAGAIAGLEVLRILNEPTAASLAYGLEKTNNETIMVFDLGGGTFDVSVLMVGGGVCEVLSTSGDTHLGGDDFDRKLVEWLADSFYQREGFDLLEDRQALQRLTEAAEKAKKDLSGLQETSISLPFIATGEDGPYHIEETLSRDVFESLCSDLFKRCRAPVQQALRDAELAPDGIDEVVLVGGSTRMPAVQALARELTGGKRPNQSVNPDEVVAIGAALQAGVLTGDVTDLVLLDVTPLSLGVETHDGMVSVLIPRNTRIPSKVTKVYSTAKDNQSWVQVKVLQGERRRADKNKELGVFYLQGIPPSPQGVPEIEVTFDINSDGTLAVAALDRATKKEMLVTIDRTSTLAPEDLEERIKEAQATATEDAQLRYAKEVRNDAESLSYKFGRLVRELSDRLPSEKRMLIESKIMTLQDELDLDDPDLELLKEITEDLREELKTALRVKIGKSGPLSELEFEQASAEEKNNRSVSL